MALSNETISKIQRAVKLFKNFLKFSNVGPHSLTTAELKDLARAGYIGRGSVPRAAIAEAYTATHLHQSNSPLGAPKSVREGALKYLERMTSLYSDKAAEELGTDIVSTLETHFMPFTNRREGEAVSAMLADPKNHGKYLGALLRDKVANWEKRYDLIVKTETNRASNWGGVDAILHNNPSKTPEEIHVYKTGIHNANSPNICKHCREFWYTQDGAPKVYTMSELLAGGTNMGKKQAAWGPTIDSTHPRCCHTVQELKPGFGFINGKLEYIGQDHNEYSHQRK